MINDIIKGLNNDSIGLNQQLEQQSIIDFSQNTAENMWTGRVTKNDDPLQLGRVKIKIFGYYDNVNEENIPWALPENNYVGSTKGAMVIPENGTLVRGYFSNGDELKPIYVANVTNVDSSKNSPDEFFNDYPHVMTLLTTDQGEFLTLNRNDGTLKFFHRSGTTIVINGDGDIQILTVNANDHNPSIELNVAGNVNVNAEQGNVDVVVKQGSVNVSAPNGKINLGDNAIDQIVEDQIQPSVTKFLVNNLPKCMVTGADHFINNTNVYA